MTNLLDLSLDHKTLIDCNLQQRYSFSPNFKDGCDDTFLRIKVHRVEDRQRRSTSGCADAHSELDLYDQDFCFLFTQSILVVFYFQT